MQQTWRYLHTLKRHNSTCALRRVGHSRVTLLSTTFSGRMERDRKKTITPRERARNFLQKCLVSKSDLKKCSYSESFHKSIPKASQFSAPTRPPFLIRMKRNRSFRISFRRSRAFLQKPAALNWDNYGTGEPNLTCKGSKQRSKTISDSNPDSRSF